VPLISSYTLHLADENHDLDVYVNIAEMLDTFSKDMIYKQMPPPFSQTLFVELVRFMPGQPETASANGATPRAPSSLHSSPRSHASHPGPSHHLHLHHGSPPMHIPMEVYPDHHVPPPPPWSRWATMSTPGRPPSTQHRHSASARSTPQPPSKKRKHADDISTTGELSRVSSSSSLSAGPAPKRRAIPAPHPSQSVASSPPRSMQTISPSIAKLLAPENVTADDMVDSWPRSRPSLSSQSPLLQAPGSA
jgi:[histone H3]-trimethyl-L-lysine4 demethylase